MSELDYPLFSSLLKGLQQQSLNYKIYIESIKMILIHILVTILFTILQTYGIAFSINSAIFTLENPIILLTVSITIFYSLCVDLARDQLQNLGYFPITNVIFLSTFTLNCTIGPFPQIKKWWTFVQIFSFGFYLLHEESTLREILYFLLQSQNFFQQVILVCFLFVSSLGFHLGIGFLFKNLLVIQKKGYKIIEQEQIGLQIDDTDIIAENEKIEVSQKQITQIQQFEQPNKLHKLFELYKDLPQILKAGLILAPPIIATISLINQLIKYSSVHSHGDQHQHMYFSMKKLYFQDVILSQNIYQIVIEVTRVMSSATIFHYCFGLWHKNLDKSNNLKEGQMKEKFTIILIAFFVVISRLLAERL